MTKILLVRHCSININEREKNNRIVHNLTPPRGVILLRVTVRISALEDLFYWPQSKS